jgi:hypothetical protein
MLLGSSSAQAASPPSVQAIGRYLCIDYEPFFPIGLYHFPDKRHDEAMWEEVAEAGFNFTLSKESGQHGIYVSKPIPWATLDGRKMSLMELSKDSRLLEKLKAFLAENEDDPTVLCWHAPDEPCWFGPSANVLQLGYQAIRDCSRKPVWLNVGPSFTQTWHYSRPEELAAACDILSEDIYPIPDGQRKRGQGYNQHAHYVGEHTAELVRLGSRNGVPSTPIWMVLQGFGWGDLGFDNPKSFVPPTHHELRYMTYDAIVHGATGILSYGPFSTESEANARFWADLKAMAGELQRHYDVLTCPSELLPEKIRIQVGDGYGETPIRILIKLMSAKVVVLTVNTRPQALEKVVFSVAPGGGRLTRVKVLEEDRDITVENGNTWADRFEGYGVHLYETDIYFSFMRRYYREPGQGERKE